MRQQPDKRAKVLFVDDEQRLLDAIERRFKSHFALSTAQGGQRALEKIEADGPFGVIVTDMRMPEMDGLQFIEQARKITRHSVFVMLTGNQDLNTAIDAVNKGQVFRYLVKPCPAKLLQETIEAAARQYDLVLSRHELLNNTLCGAVKLLYDVLELAQPERVAQVQEIQRVLERLSVQLKLSDQWEFKIAARLAHVGSIAVVNGDSVAAATNTEEAEIAARLVSHIPRLENVAEMIRRLPLASGAFPDGQSPDELIERGATVLRLAHVLHKCHRRKMSLAQLATEIYRELPDLPPHVAEAATVVYQQIRDESTNIGVLEVSPHDLVQGMVLAEHVLREDGTRILSEGTVLSTMFIHRIRHLAAQGKVQTPIRVLPPQQSERDGASQSSISTGIGPQSGVTSCNTAGPALFA